VIGFALQHLDPPRVGNREAGVERAQPAYRRGAERGKRVDRRVRSEREIPLDFDPDAIADQRELAEIVAECGGAAPVAAVDRADRGQRRVELCVARSALLITSP